MKKLVLIVIALTAIPMFAGTINLNGPHYNLNIVGKRIALAPTLRGQIAT